MLRTAVRRLKTRYRLAAALRRRRSSGAIAIGVTGSSAKTTTVELLSHILESRGPTHRLLEGNTLGPLVDRLREMPLGTAFAVMELAIGQKGTMAPMAAVLEPDIGIVTMVADEHRSTFRGREGVAAEKQAMIAALRPDGLAILNADDDLVMAMARVTEARSVTFGRSEAAQYRATDIHAAWPDRLSLTMHWPGGRLDLRTQFIAEHFWLPVAAAVTAALEIGLDPASIAKRVATFEPMPTRCGVLQAPDGPTFVVDTTKAPFHSLGLVFDMLKQARATRKRAVVGHIADYAGKPKKAYGAAWQAASEFCYEAIFIGEHAHRTSATEEDRICGRFREALSVREIAEHIAATQQPGEVILIKGSRKLHLERVALAQTTEVRCWEDVCGFSRSCFECGKYGMPFAENRALKAARKRPRLLKRIGRRLNPFRR